MLWMPSTTSEKKKKKKKKKDTLLLLLLQRVHAREDHMPGYRFSLLDQK